MKYTVLILTLGLCSCSTYEPTAEDLARLLDAASYITNRVDQSSGK